MGNIFVVGPETQVVAAKRRSPMIAVNKFGRGRSVYFSGHKYTPENVRLLHSAIFFAAQAEERFGVWLPGNVKTEAAYYPAHQKLVVVNNSAEPQKTAVRVPGRSSLEVEVEAYGSKILDI